MLQVNDKNRKYGTHMTEVLAKMKHFVKHVSR